MARNVLTRPAPLVRHPARRFAGSLITAATLLSCACPSIALAKQSTPSTEATRTGATVSTAEGRVQGAMEQGVLAFRGIPYAAPPVGALRWLPPQPVQPWRGTRKAIKFADSCPQVTTLGPFAGPTSVSEDCLYLNVFTTVTAASAAPKPVIVWIHGGGNTTGASTDYDAGKLAKGASAGGVDAVVVTFNYRLGLLGTLSHPAINAEGHAWGNYQTLDQQAVLQWVKRNIARFGGDPARVALGGQSAGAYDVGANVISPAANGLFQRAILMSSPAFFAWTVTAETADTAGNAFAKAAGCSGTDAEAAKCLRALSVPRILQLQGTPNAGAPFIVGRPFVDGTIVPMQPEQAWTSGRFNRVAVMGGSTRDEGTFFTGINEYFSGPPQTPIAAAQYPAMVQPGAFCIFCNAVRKMPEGVAERYPLAKFDNDPMVAYQRIGTDGAKCTELHVLQKLASQVPTYGYDFRYQSAPFYFPKMPGYKPLASHTVDLQFVFPGFHGGQLGVNLDQAIGMPRELQGAEIELSDRMVAAWTRFADTGNPNGTGDQPWPRFGTDDNARYLVQDTPSSTRTVAEFKADHNCDFFEPQLKY